MTCLPLLAALALLAAAPAETSDESHYLITFRGQTIGKATRTLARTGAGDAASLALTVAESYSFSTGDRPSAPVALKRRAAMRSDWTPVTVAETSEQTGGAPRTVRFEKELAVFTLPDGKEKAVPFRGAAVVELAGEALCARGELKAGGRLAAVVPDLGRAELVLQRAEVIGEKTVEGRAGKLFLVQIKDGGGRVAWDLLVDETGRLEESASGDMVRRRVAREQAVLPDRPAALAAGLIPLEGAPGKPWRLERLTLELTLPDDASGLVPEFYGQKASASGRKVTATVTARRPDGRLPAEELSADARQRALAPENEPDWREPEIRERAASIVKGVDGDLKKGFLIGRWVHRNLEKNLGGPPEASGLQALKQRGGDCSEHAALFAALARAAGLPARTAWGLVADEKGLHFHVWSEFYADGRWVPLDAALGRFGLPACYLNLGYDREEAGVRLFRLYAAARGKVLKIEEAPAAGAK